MVIVRKLSRTTRFNRARSQYMSGQTALPTQKNKKADSDIVNAEIALKRAAKKARKEAQKAGVGVIVLRNGQIVEEFSCKKL